MKPLKLCLSGRVRKLARVDAFHGASPDVEVIEGSILLLSIAFFFF